MHPQSKSETIAAGTDQFLLRVIHDLRGPLRKMYTRAQLLQEGNAELSDENRSHVNAIIEANRYSDVLLSRLSEYCFCETDRNAFDAIPVPSSPCLKTLSGRNVWA